MKGRRKELLSHAEHTYHVSHEDSLEGMLIGACATSHRLHSRHALWGYLRVQRMTSVKRDQITGTSEHGFIQCH